jgi:aryl-alcohol dehydrogenase-like predicted oxidoreductase
MKVSQATVVSFACQEAMPMPSQPVRTSSVEQLESNVRALECRPFTPDELAVIDRALA